MSFTIKKNEDIVLTRAQFEKLKKNGGLIIGSTYKIKDDPTANDLVDGIFSSKRAEQDSNGEVISNTYQRKDESYSSSEIDAKFNNTSEYYNSELLSIKDVITQNRNDILSLKETSSDMSIIQEDVNTLKDTITDLQAQVDNKITTSNTIDNLQPGQYTFLTIEE